MERFYILDISELPDPEFNPESLEELDEVRKEKCLLFTKAEDRKRCLGSGKIINRILKDFNISSPIKISPKGKPYTEGIYFNVSHSGRYVIGAASLSPIGCDIEKMTTPPLKVSKRCFTDVEREYILKSNNSSLSFWQLWTLKESYIKMTGEGLSLPLSAFEIVMGEKITVLRDKKEQDCTFKNLIYDGYCISVCLSSKR